MALAPKTFKFDDNGKAELVAEIGDDDATVKSAADSCPVQAIAVE